MKFITITVLFALIACSLSNEPPRQAEWCGSSVVYVSIITKENGKEASTNAKLVVPVNLKKSATHMVTDSKTKKDVMNTGSLISKTHQGIIFTLNGPADMSQLGKFFEKDEDSDNDIYIPYSFITSIEELAIPVSNPQDFTINLFLRKDFKTKLELNPTIIEKMVTIKFEKDDKGTPICNCMFEFLVDRIRFNWSLRNESLKYIRLQLFSYIEILYSNYNTLNKIQSNDKYKDSIEVLKRIHISQKKDCSDIKIKFDDEIEEKIEFSRKFNEIIIPDCSGYEIQIFNLENKFSVEVEKDEEDIESAMDHLRYQRRDYEYAMSSVLSFHKLASSDIEKALSYTEYLDQSEKVSLNSNVNIFKSIKVEYPPMGTIDEIKYLEEANKKYHDLSKFFTAGFGKN